MIIYYSGAGSLRQGVPEIALGDEANLMLTYNDFIKTGKPNGRFREILKVRKRKKKGKRK